MRYVRDIALFCVFAIAISRVALAGVETGPGFDPAPVEIPTIAKTTPRAVTGMDLLNLRDFHGAQISPDGKWVAFVLGQAVYESNSYRSGLFIVSTEKGSKPICLGTAGPPHWKRENQWLEEDPQWSEDSKYVFYRLRNGGTWQVWKWNRGGGDPTQVTRVAHNVLSFQITADGTKLILAVEKPSLIDKKQLAEHGILYDGSFRPGAPRPVLDEMALDRTDPGRGPGRGVETETWIRNLQESKEHMATEEESGSYVLGTDVRNEKQFSKAELDSLSIGRTKLSPDGKSVAYERRLDPSESPQSGYPLFLKPTRGGKPVALTPGVLQVLDFWWSPDSKEIYYTEDRSASAEDPRPAKLMAVSATGRKARKVSDAPGLQGSCSLDRSGRLLVCTQEDVATPAQLRLIDLSTGGVRTLVDANPEFQNLQLSPNKRIDVSNQYRDHYWGHLVFPLNYEPGRRYPLVITTYLDRGMFFRGGVGDEYPIYVFAANGFAVLNFDEGEFHNSTPGDFETQLLYWASPIDGVAALIKKLADMGIVDSSRVGITGLSHGAELLDYGISHTDLFRASIASSTGYDPITYYLTSDFFRGDMSAYSLESPDGASRGRWQRISAALNARKRRRSIGMAGLRQWPVQI